MRSAEAQGTEECPVKMKLVAPPLYVLTTQTLDKVNGVEVLKKVGRCAVALWSARRWWPFCRQEMPD